MVPRLGDGRDQVGWIVRPLLCGNKVAKEQVDGLEGAFTGGGFPCRVCEPLGDLFFGDGQGCLGWVGACEVLDPALACDGRRFGFPGCELPGSEGRLMWFPKHGGLLM